MKRRRPIWLAALTGTGLWVWVFIAVFPFFWMFLISFREPVHAFSSPPTLFAPMTLENFPPYLGRGQILAVRNQHGGRHLGHGRRIFDDRLLGRLRPRPLPRLAGFLASGCGPCIPGPFRTSFC